MCIRSDDHLSILQHSPKSWRSGDNTQVMFDWHEMIALTLRAVVHGSHYVTHPFLPTTRGGNVFTSVCHYAHGGGSSVSVWCHLLSVWSHSPSGGSVYVGLRWRPQRQRHTPPKTYNPILTSSGSHCSSQYASYWNTFLYIVCFQKGIFHCHTIKSFAYFTNSQCLLCNIHYVLGISKYCEYQRQTWSSVHLKLMIIVKVYPGYLVTLQYWDWTCNHCDFDCTWWAVVLGDY